MKGYRILDRQVRLGVGEIDLVAKRGRLLLLVEVKRRQNLTAAAEALRPKQRQRIARAAEVYLQRRPDCQGLDLRFDVVLLAPWRLPRHIVSAWEGT
ncbi:MAG: hypothetical protein Kilf2KO_19380 [Rhodospirillales bacterium]